MVLTANAIKMSSTRSAATRVAAMIERLSRSESSRPSRNSAKALLQAQAMNRLVSLIISILIVSAVAAADAPKTANTKQPAVDEPKRELYEGKVVLAQEALKRRGIKVADEMKSQAVLETDNGELIPIAADWRGRALYQDKRLRDRKVQLIGYRRPGLPYLQVLIIYTFDEKQQRQETDYWCDVCSIPMYEIKECECCQGEIRLRFRNTKLPDYLDRSSK